MDLDLQQRVQKRLTELPQDVQAAIHSSDLAQKVQAIGKKNNLHVDQMGKLEDEVYLVMLGFADPGEFADTLAAELGVTSAQAASVANEVGNEIFMPIRASMQEWSESKIVQDDAALVSTALGTKKDTVSPQEPSATVPNAPLVSKIPPLPSTPPPATAPTPAPATAVDLTAAEAMLAEKKVTAPQKTEVPKPQQYKADPYREPVE
jgi:hypothetical protein